MFQFFQSSGKQVGDERIDLVGFADDCAIVFPEFFIVAQAGFCPEADLSVGVQHHVVQTGLIGIILDGIPVGPDGLESLVNPDYVLFFEGI